VRAADRTALAREHLRRRYRPAEVRLLFVGESPPASGRFFYQADSGLYRAMRETFVTALPNVKNADFLESFRARGCYLVDLSGVPVDRMSKEQRRKTCEAGEVRLSQVLKKLRPQVVITLVRSIAANVRRSQQKANWKGKHLELPYPGRWRDHRIAFKEGLVPFLREQFSADLKPKPGAYRRGRGQESALETTDRFAPAGDRFITIMK
jgi:hypothetical protein